MTNLEALRAQCKLLCNTCYVDKDVLVHVLSSFDMYSDDEATPLDPNIIRGAILIVKGWAETSRSEQGFSTSVDMAKVQQNIMYWCGQAGLDASEFVDDIVTIDTASNLW